MDSSLEALVHLLADDHKEVVEAARAKLVELGDRAAAFLQKTAAFHPDPKVRVEAQGVLEMLRLLSVGKDWQAAIGLPDNEPDLEGGALLLARVCYPDLDPSPYRKRLDELASRVRPKVEAVERPMEKLAALNRVLFRDERFRGNWSDYFDPQNSYLNRVLDRKLGIPISLSVVYLLVARRVGIPLAGVGVPGHFMVKCQDDGKEVFIDTFNEGRFLTRAECIQFVVEAGYPYQVEYLEGIGTRDILARMLRNLILIYVDRHEPTLEKTLSRFLDQLYAGQGDAPQERLEYE